MASGGVVTPSWSQACTRYTLQLSSPSTCQLGGPGPRKSWAGVACRGQGEQCERTVSAAHPALASTTGCHTDAQQQDKRPYAHRKVQAQRGAVGWQLPFVVEKHGSKLVLGEEVAEALERLLGASGGGRREEPWHRGRMPTGSCQEGLLDEGDVLGGAKCQHVRSRG